MTSPCPVEFGMKACDKLQALGMCEVEAANKAVLFTRGCELLQKQCSTLQNNLMMFFVPGRIEVLGKHTDYCGGRSLLCTVNKGLCFCVSPRNDSVVRIYRTDNNEARIFDLSMPISPLLGDWSNYPMTAARRITQNFGSGLKGADITIASDLPQAAGMSSSSAVIVGMWMILSQINALQETSSYRENITCDEDLAGYMGCIENGQTFKGFVGDEGVGTFGGSQDHTAILFSESDRIKQYGFGPVKHEDTVELDKDYSFVVGVCGVTANKTGNAKDKYNRASLAVREIVLLWQKEHGKQQRTLASIIRSNVDAYQDLLCLIDTYQGVFDRGTLRLRLRQFVEESEQIIPLVEQFIAKQRVDEIGTLVDRSQFLSEAYLGNQIDQTSYLARSARECGAIASSAFGAGFGGSVWALVKTNEAIEFMHQWANQYVAYDEDAGRQSCFFVSHPGICASRVL